MTPPDHRPTPLGRWSRPLTVVAVVAGAIMLALGAVSSLIEDDPGPFLGRLVFVGVLVAVMGPLELMQRSGRGVAAPMGTAESRWSLVAFASALGVAAGLGAAWAASADHIGLAVALGVFVLLALVGVVGALVGPAESMRGLRPGERPHQGVA